VHCLMQMNQITGYQDGSNIYGSSLSAQRELREGRGGRLAIQNVGGRQLLPANRGECTDDTERLACFKAGECALELVSGLESSGRSDSREH
jgi:peroxidase